MYFMSFVGLYWRARCKTLRMWKWAFQISFQAKSLGFLRSVLPVEHISKDKDKPAMSKICHVPGVSKCILGANHRRHVCENCCWLKLGLNLGTATAKVFLVIPWFCFVRAILVGTIQKLNGLKLCQVPIVRFSSEF